jgi:transcriptional regulator with XRE-family HTH domain
VTDESDLVATVTQQLAEARRASGITIEQLAERLDTAVQNVHRIEKGQNITLRTLERVARALGQKVRFRLVPDPQGPKTPPPGRKRRAT